MSFATDNERDEAEWRNPANWHGGWLGIYYSKRDSRSFVPKRNPNFGVTINFARKEGIVLLLCVLAVVLLVNVLTFRK